jgi:hypothetical protein
MLIIKGDNRSILRDMPFSFLSGNTLSGVSSFGMSSTDNFLTDDFLIAGEINGVGSELLQIDSVTDINTIVLKTPSVYAHSESTKITKVPYNQVKFYRNTIPTFSTTTLLATVDINPQSLFTTWNDNIYSSGYAFFIFYNSQTDTKSASSNPIDYAGFPANSAYSIIKSFLSSLNNVEMKLLTFSDCFSYISEGLSIAVSELNLSNQEYKTQPQVISTVSGTQEYDLEDDFSRLVSVSNEDGSDIPYIKQSEIKKNDEDNEDMRYFIRGSKIGFSPTPTSIMNVYINYSAKSTSLTSYYDLIDLPNNGFWVLKDYLIYASASKLNVDRQTALSYRQVFMDNVNKLKVNSNKQNTNKDSFSIDKSACV